MNPGNSRPRDAIRLRADRPGRAAGQFHQAVEFRLGQRGGGDVLLGRRWFIRPGQAAVIALGQNI
jgi:hypothetical protein